MHDVFGKGQIGMTNHTVGLQRTGQTAEGERTQHKIGGIFPKDTNPPGDFQKTADAP